MKTIYLTLIILFIKVVYMEAQDAIIYYQGIYYTYPQASLPLYKNMNPVIVVSDGDEISIDIISANTAVKVTKLDANNNPLPYPQYFFVYTEKDFPEVFGTDQYENCHLKVECFASATTYQQMPQPQIFVPFDISNLNPNPDNDHYIDSPKAGHTMLMLRKAFFWENSESATYPPNLSDPHGPYADIKIGAYNTSVMNHSELALFQNNSLWDASSQILHKIELPGPIWSGYAPGGSWNPCWPFGNCPLEYPDPYDEWIDGPFGCIYSNIYVYDWGISPSVSQNVAIIVSESDSPDSFMGRSSFTINPTTTGPILVKIWGFGWVVLENVVIPSSGLEKRVDIAEVYWYGGWNGNYPVDVYGPQNAAIPNQNSNGSQFKPFTNSQFQIFHNNTQFNGYKVGLLGGNFPAMLLDKPRTYYAIDKPAFFN